ncbi:HemY protein [Caulobacter ginsengisoli]|uniref:HemY protein n=1 Tax=Caulobacter ginsengisoli TaxID=400775 RepID=A0ABU0IU08_9CAUL|nr:heme biosynthesis HemY N-terminal domain-containing protein [Caulobacter ginsengisoli]MDQ0465492.1 HemY protein [Caulobacter ginsengisoli]
MIRIALVLALAAAVAVAVLGARDPGAAHMIWLGYRVDMTAAAAALLTLFAALMATILWRGLLWLLEAPARAARGRQDGRRKQGGEALTRGFLAAAAGDGSEARRLAQKAADLVDDMPHLVRVLAAQAAEAAGDMPAAKAAYQAMMGFPDMRLAGLKGQMQIALAEGDRVQALRHAQAAYGLAKTARWAWRALLESRLEGGDWAAALELIQGAQERKIVSPIVADRTRAALLAASAAAQETAPDERMRKDALDYATQSAKLAPDFAPGVVMAARLLAADGKAQRAAGLIETAWEKAPHPALWLAYRDLRTDETPRERAKRLAALAARNPASRESRILSVESALIGGEIGLARLSAKTLEAEPLTARLAGLMARAAHAAGATDEARAWIARGAAAPQEPDWSDLDPEGRAFAYAPADWARLVSSYAETGELIHPRLERSERGLSDLPELPVGYAESAPFVQAAETGAPIMPIPDDPGFGPDFGFDYVAAPPEPVAPPPRPAPRGGRRAASPRGASTKPPRTSK